jgi:hypothetical protein
MLVLAMNAPKRAHIARKYCFKATATLYNKDRTFGTFVSYGKTIEVAKNVELACQICLNESEDFEEAVWDEVKIIAYEECPQECSAKVFWVPNVEDEEEAN